MIGGEGDSEEEGETLEGVEGVAGDQEGGGKCPRK